jgi:hypothetical protein
VDASLIVFVWRAAKVGDLTDCENLAFQPCYICNGTVVGTVKANSEIMKRLLIFAMLVIASRAASAQMFYHRHTANIGFGLQACQPVGDFAQQFNGYPIGLAGTFSSPIMRSPIELGFAFAWNNMGTQNHDVSVPVGKDEQGNQVYSNGTIHIRSNMYRYDGFVRFRPFAGNFQPYIDGLFGISQFRTNTNIAVDNTSFSTATSSQQIQKDYAFNAGYAIGLRLRLGPLFFLEGRFENLKGGQASYVDRNSVSLTPTNQVNFNTKTSHTNMYTYQIGLSIQLP